MDSFLLLFIAIGGILIVGAFAYLLGQNKALKSDNAASKELITQLEQSKKALEAGPPMLIMSVPTGGPSKPIPPKLIEIEQELDEITDKLEWSDDHKPLKANERQVLEAKYDNLIHQMVEHFVKQSDRAFYTSSLTGAKNTTEGTNG